MMSSAETVGCGWLHWKFLMMTMMKYEVAVLLAGQNGIVVVVVAVCYIQCC